MSAEDPDFRFGQRLVLKAIGYKSPRELTVAVVVTEAVQPFVSVAVTV